MIDPIKVREQVEAAKVKWAKSLEAEGGIERYVRQCLDGNMNHAIAGSLGFSNHWGKWEVDHTNNKSTPLTRAIDAVVEGIVPGMVEEALKTWKPSAALKKAIRDEYRHYLERCIRREVENRAANDTKQVLDSILEEAIPEPRALYDPAGNLIGEAVLEDDRWVLKDSEAGDVHIALRLLAKMNEDG